MYDALNSVTTVLTGATTVNSTAIDLRGRGPVVMPLVARVRYPQNPTGTGPTVKAMLQQSTDNSTFVDLRLLHDTISATTGFPKIRRCRFNNDSRYVRVAYTLANADNVYGSAVWEVTVADDHHPS